MLNNKAYVIFITGKGWFALDEEHTEDITTEFAHAKMFVTEVDANWYANHKYGFIKRNKLEAKVLEVTCK